MKLTSEITRWARGTLVTRKLLFDWAKCLFFFVFSVTVFYLVNFACEANVNFKGLIFTGALWDLECLQSFLFKVGKSSANCFSFFVRCKDIDDQSELFRKEFYFWKMLVGMLINLQSEMCVHIDYHIFSCFEASLNLLIFGWMWRWIPDLRPTE